MQIAAELDGARERKSSQPLNGSNLLTRSQRLLRIYPRDSISDRARLSWKFMLRCGELPRRRGNVFMRAQVAYVGNY